MTPDVPTSADFIRAVQSRFRLSEPETFWSCQEPLRRFLNDGGVTQSINTQLKRLAGDHYYFGDWLANETVLFRGAGWELSIALLEPRRYIHALPFYAMYAPLSEAALAGDRYRLPDGFRNDVFDPALRLTPAGQFLGGRGEVIAIESGQYAYDFHLPDPLPVLRFATTAIRPLEWLFSKPSLQAWQANDADLSFTQLRVAAAVLGKIAHQSSIGPLRQLAGHPHHAVRWAAIQNLGRLNRTEALAKIRAAVDDPHPHVRRAAQRTLERFERGPAK